MTERCTAWQASSNNLSCTEKWKQGFTHRGTWCEYTKNSTIDIIFPLLYYEYHWWKLCVYVCVEMNAMSQYPCHISETSHNCQIYYSGISHVRVCVCGGEKNAMSQCLCITVTSLKLLTIVRYIILSSVMSVCVCVKKHAMIQYPCNISETSHNCQIYIFCHLSCPCLCEREMPWANMRVTLLKLLTIVRHVLSSVMSACVCVKKKTMSQYPWNISEISHNCQIYHSVICHVRVCVCERECHEPVSV